MNGKLINNLGLKFIQKLLGNNTNQGICLITINSVYQLEHNEKFRLTSSILDFDAFIRPQLLLFSTDIIKLFRCFC